MQNRFIKIALALCLTAAMILCTFPSSVLAATMELKNKKGSDYTSNATMASKLQTLFDKLVYSDAPYFTVSGTSSCGNTACPECELKAVASGHPNLKTLGLSFDTTAYGSGAFARFALLWIFGAKVSAINYFGNPVGDGSLLTYGRVSASSAMMVGSDYKDMNVGNLKELLQAGTPGDLVQCRSTTGANHSMILLSAGSSSVQVLHTVDYEGTGIDMNKAVISSMSYDEIIGSWGQVISLIRVDAAHYSAVWGNGAHTHNYTDAGGDKCTICGEAITPKRSVTGAGVYTASGSAQIYKYCYFSSGVLSTLSRGDYIEVIGTIVNSIGKSFYILPGGGYAACDDFKAGNETNVPVISIGNYPTGEIRKGMSFGLSGNVTFTSGLSYVAGYLISDGGKIVQSAKDVTSSSYYDISQGAVNNDLRFSSLAETSYTYMVVACGKNGAMSCFTSTFTVSRNAVVTPPAPAAPTVETLASTSVTLTSFEGYEYSMDGTNWQTSATFENLNAFTPYTFYQRVAATADAGASLSSPGITVTTAKTAPLPPAAPTLIEVTDTTVRLDSLGYNVEYSSNGGASWQNGTTFTGLTSNTTYSFTARYAETATTGASAPSEVLKVKTDYTKVSAPSAPTLVSVVGKTVTLKGDNGAQFSCDEGKTWQYTSSFTFADYGTYSFICRFPATERTYVSEPSAALSVKVYPTTLTSKSLNVNQPGSFVTGVKAGTTCAELISAFNESAYVTLQSANGAAIARTATVCSGMCLLLPGGTKYVVSVAGDLDGDGEANIFDLFFVEDVITAGASLSDVERLSANVAGDKEIDISDFSALLYCILDGDDM